MNFRIGCAIWAYKGWLGGLFPTGSSPSKFLQLYSQRFTTVECNATFYSIPSADTVTRWEQETPNGFEFCPKMPRSITHEGTLTSQIEAALSFIELMQGLGSRLGPIFAQLPPTYGPQSFQDLETFLMGLQDCGAPLSLEVRHPQWYEPTHAIRLNELLQRLSIGRVLLDTRPIYECDDNPQLTSERRKPKLPLQPIATSPFVLIRYISHPDRDFNHSFMEYWVPYLQDWLQQGTRIYLIIHCPVEEHSPQNARYFQQLLEDKRIPISPLPWNDLPVEPSQLSLF
ncbi:MAG: DUF72 domain-containing protein [Acaryochloridaceae cyanobacterium RU_4_10]|nr:DUF72 domain-containing protein [Acaryochloridaceae cyanobacterium RU_4_10]